MQRAIRTSDPAVEPVTVAEAKNHLRVDISDDDALIGALITAAREMIEERSRRALITQTWRRNLDAWPAISLNLPRPPLQSVTSITYTDGDGNTSTVDSSIYSVDTDSQPGRVALAYDQQWPTVATLATLNPIKITYVAGYGDAASDVPQRWKQAILLTVGHWYENREATVTGGGIPKELPLAVESLINLDRAWV